MTSRIPTKKTVSHATATTSSAPVEQAPAALSPKTGIALVFIQPPPADAKIPTPPSGSATPNGGNYRTLVPKATELAALTGAVADLKRFTTFSDVLGLAGVPYAEALQAFDVGNQWSTMRRATAAWEAYCLTEEGLAWMTIRQMLDALRPVWDLVVARDPSLTMTYPSLAKFLGAQKAIAQKGAATKRLNKAAVAEGKPPVHGTAGKKRKKAADKAVVASVSSASATSASVSAPAPAPQAHAPIATGTATS
jgi:hypothetical protein